MSLTIQQIDVLRLIKRSKPVGMTEGVYKITYGIMTGLKRWTDNDPDKWHDYAGSVASEVARQVFMQYGNHFQQEPEGTYWVSPTVRPLIACLPEELATVLPLGGGAGRLVLTEKGKTVLEYLT